MVTLLFHFPSGHKRLFTDINKAKGLEIEGERPVGVYISDTESNNGKLKMQCKSILRGYGATFVEYLPEAEIKEMVEK